jgi:RNA polymerase sigma-70 factor (ECF subfamily)
MKRTDFQGELERLHAASFGWALWCCEHRREEAEEVLQSAYLKVLEGRARFGGESSLRTWFFGVIRRTAAERRRRRWVREQLLGRWLASQPGAAVAADPEEEACGSQRGRGLLQAVAGLPERQREVLHLVFYQEMTVEEASRVMKVSLGTARTHFARGKAGLRRKLGPAEGEDDGQ